MGRRVIDYEQVVDAGVVLLRRDGTLQLEALTRSLAVSRATLYRVVDGLDALLADVLCTMSREALRRAHAACRCRGLDAVVETAVCHLERIDGSPVFRRLLTTEPETAARVLLLPKHRVHDRHVEDWRQLLVGLRERDGLRLPCGDVQAAGLLVSVGSSLLHQAVQSSRAVDTGLARRSFRALLDVPEVVDLRAPAPRAVVVGT